MHPEIERVNKPLDCKKSTTCSGHKTRQAGPQDGQAWSTDVPGNTKGGSITVPLTSCLTGLESAE